MNPASDVRDGNTKLQWKDSSGTGVRQLLKSPSSTGLRSAIRSQTAAYWASWADSLPGIPTLQTLSGSPCSEADFQKAAIFRLQQPAGKGLWMSDSMPQSRGTFPEGREQADPQTTGTPQNHVSGGNVWPALTSRTFLHGCRLARAFTGGRALLRSQCGPFAGIPFTCSPVVWSSRAWNLRSSGFCSFVVFGAPSLSLLTSAGAAVDLTFVATTGQLVGGQGCWDVECSRWRVQQLAVAERQGEGLSQRPRG